MLMPTKTISVFVCVSIYSGAKGENVIAYIKCVCVCVC